MVPHASRGAAASRDVSCTARAVLAALLLLAAAPLVRAGDGVAGPEPAPTPTPAPAATALGADGEAVLAEAGFRVEEIAGLRSDGVI